jgi:hypothetical protein
MDTNPSLVQEGRKKLASSIPVVLIHDGGGSTFGYYTLGDLQPERELWAIHNPDFKRSRPYPMTMEEMAQNYIYLIQSSGIRGPIYLGGKQRSSPFHSASTFSILLPPSGTDFRTGWSLGGLLSVVIANLLSKSTTPVSFSLAGILLIESPFHRPWREIPPVRTVDFSHLPVHAKNCLNGCNEMLKEWAMPSTGPKGWLPRAVLIRSVERVPTGPGESSELPARVDVCRDDKILGWGHIGQEFIINTLDVESNHYNIFAMDKVMRRSFGHNMTTYFCAPLIIIR